MMFSVEVGTAEQRNIIEHELELIQTIVGAFQPPLNISQVIVPADFDQKVNELQNTNDYKHVRSVVEALATVLEIDYGIAMIISPRIYTEEWDFQKRVFIYLHEIFHVVNKKRIPRAELESRSLSLYFENIYRLFDEYASDRQAHECVDELFPSKSDLMRCLIDSSIHGFIRIINDPQYYEQISKEIAYFRIYDSDVETFLKNIHDSFSNVAMSIVHLYSYIDSYADYQCKVDDLCNSRFVNNRTSALIDFFRKKYGENHPGLVEGLSLVKEFMLNFGMRFEDTEQGLYCHVLDT